MTQVNPAELESPDSIPLFREGEEGKEVDYYWVRGKTAVDAVKRLRHDTYLQCGFIDSPYPDGVIPDKADNDAAVYLAAVVNNEVIGGIRLAAPPFKVLDVVGDELYEDVRDRIKEMENNPAKNKAVELGSLAVKSGTGYKHISGSLYKAVYRVSLMEGIKYWLIDIDERVYNALLRLGWKVDEIGPRHEYMGSVTVPGLMSVQEQTESIRDRNPEYYSYLKKI